LTIDRMFDTIHRGRSYPAGALDRICAGMQPNFAGRSRPLHGRPLHPQTRGEPELI